MSWNSNFQMKYPDKFSDIPPCKTASDRRWSLCWSILSMRAYLKQMVELGQVFRWSAELGQLVRWSTQITSQIYPSVSDEVHIETQIFRWSVQIQIYPPFSDEVHTETQTWNKEMSSYFQMKCSDKLSDIPPPVSDEVLRWSSHWDPNPKWGNVHIFRWSVQIRCQIYSPL